MKCIIEHAKAHCTPEQLKTGFYGCTVATLRRLVVAMSECLSKGATIVTKNTVQWKPDHLAHYEMPDLVFMYDEQPAQLFELPSKEVVDNYDATSITPAELVEELYFAINEGKRVVVSIEKGYTLRQMQVLFHALTAVIYTSTTHDYSDEGRLIKSIDGHSFNPANSDMVDRMLLHCVKFFSANSHKVIKFNDQLMDEDIRFEIFNDGTVTHVNLVSEDKTLGFFKVSKTGDLSFAHKVKTSLNAYPFRLKYITKAPGTGNDYNAKSRPHPCNKKSIQTVQLNFF
jgi:hypothetical protein